MFDKHFFVTKNFLTNITLNQNVFDPIFLSPHSWFEILQLVQNLKTLMRYSFSFTHPVFLPPEPGNYITSITHGIIDPAVPWGIDPPPTGTHN